MQVVSLGVHTDSSHVRVHFFRDAGRGEILLTVAARGVADLMIDFNERDLVRFAEAAGFDEVHLQLNVAVRSPDPMRGRPFINIAPNPRLPSLAEAMQQVLNADETERFNTHLQPLVEHGAGHRRLTTSQLWAARGYRARMAGLRTNAPVAVGATLFVLLWAYGFRGATADPTRVAAR